jgi:5'-nucleotidase
MAEAPEILITNDDGIHAPGLLALHRALQAVGRVQMVAPDEERSAFGHAITMSNPLRTAKYSEHGEPLGTAVSGTPADCVKLAVNTLLERPPRLIVSGINPGPNTGTNVLYSGTVSAATEGTILGIPSLAVSLDLSGAKADFTAAAAWAVTFARWILGQGLPEGVLLNVNVPALGLREIKGLRVTRLARYRYRDRYEIRQDPRGRTYYWLTGEDAEVLNPAPDVDEIVLRDGYVSVTPLAYDLTCAAYAPELATKLQDLGVPG